MDVDDVAPCLGLIKRVGNSDARGIGSDWLEYLLFDIDEVAVDASYQLQLVILR